MSFQSSGEKEIVEHDSEKASVSPNPNSSSTDPDEAAAVQPGGFTTSLTAAWRYVCGKTSAGGAQLLTAIRRAAESSEREAAMKARCDVAKHAMDKQLEMIQEQHRHEREMMKRKGVMCGFKDCEAYCDDSIALMKHVETCHSGVKCHVQGCEALLDNSSAVERHIQLCHRAMFVCPEESCKSSFSNTNDLCRHVLDCHANKSASN